MLDFWGLGVQMHFLSRFYTSSLVAKMKSFNLLFSSLYLNLDYYNFGICLYNYIAYIHLLYVDLLYVKKQNECDNMSRCR